MIAVLAELMVCVLLATTISYCVVLDRRLRVLKADEQAMRKTIVDLLSATENAERAVAGLRNVVAECDQTIATHLREAERQSQDLAIRIRSGDEVIARIGRIVETARGGALDEAAPQPQPAQGGRLAATLAAAQALAERARHRAAGVPGRNGTAA